MLTPRFHVMRVHPGLFCFLSSRCFTFFSVFVKTTKISMLHMECLVVKLCIRLQMDYWKERFYPLWVTINIRG